MLRSLKNIFITAALYLLMTVTSHAANTGNTMIKTYSTYNYQQTREHLIAAIESNNLVFFRKRDIFFLCIIIQSIPANTVFCC